jgi:TolB-like protein/Flp pilus assembly protein TadD/DNA-binding winged helix-turn-helix (wHTH) protein
MDAASLTRDGFRVGDWLIGPGASRATDAAGRSVELTPNQSRLLVALVLHHGEPVARRSLRESLWPGEVGTEERLRETVAGLRALFADHPRHPRYIASVGQDAYALLARFEPAAPAAAPEAAPTAGRRLHWLLSELRRRNVVKVAVSYLVGTWIVLQVAQVTFAPLHFPDWWMTALTILAIIGLPIVTALAWTYEITEQGIVLDVSGDGAAVVKLPRARQSLAPAIVVGVAAMAAVTGFAWWRSLDAPVPRDGSDSKVAPPSVAVLPLVDLTPRGDTAWLGDGLSEELATRLAQVPGLRVAARSSAFEFRGRNLDVRRIGQSLGVRHVLEGSVRRDGDALRVTVQLIDARTGFHVWAGNFDRAWRDVLSLQDEIARSVTAALRVVLVDEPGGTSTGAAANLLDARAVDPYLEGLALLRQPGDRSTLEKAEQAFRAAIRIAPGFAGAQAGLCRVLVRSFDLSRDRKTLAEAEQACRRSLALDATLIDTEKALAGLYVSDGRFGDAAETYSKAIARNARDADALLGLGQAYEGLGRAREAEASLRKATEVEPAYWSTHMALGGFLFQRGRADEALAAFRRVTELVPSSAVAWSNVGAVLQLKGDLAGAEQAYVTSLKLEPSKGAYSNVATIQFVLGRFEEAAGNFGRAIELAPHDQIVHGNLADALWQIEARREEAMQAYRRAIELAEQELAATPNDSVLRAQVGYYYGRVGDARRSLAYLDEALRAGPELLYVQYYRGVAAVDRGDRETALAAVADMIKLGYPREQLRSAPEFRGLLQDPEYKNLVG